LDVELLKKKKERKKERKKKDTKEGRKERQANEPIERQTDR